MWVESEGIPGKGSTFHFTILTQKDTSNHLKETEELPIDLIGLKVLIVDDNQTNRDILDRYTCSWKMIPSAVGSAQEAIDRINQGEVFDIGILDFQLPDRDGLSLAGDIHAILNERTFPLVLLSSLGYHEPKGEESKFAAYLTKPIKPSQLFDCLSFAYTHLVPGERNQYIPNSTHFSHDLGMTHPLQILLVEDNTVNQTVALSLLNRLGYRADLASNGLEALDALRRQSYDLILMDVQMPEMDGIEAAQSIRTEFSAVQQPRIVAMTANAMQGDRENYLAAGMDDYISKPIYLDELVRALKESNPLKTGFQPSFNLTSEIEPNLIREFVSGRRDIPILNSEQADEVLDGDRLEAALHISVLTEFKEMLGDEGEQTVINVVSLYLTDTNLLLDQMRKAIATEDLEQTRRAAHTLKGNSNQIGSIPLANCCFELEKLAKSGSFVGAGELFGKIEEEYAYVRMRLKTAFRIATVDEP